MLSGSMVEASALSGSKYWAAQIIYAVKKKMQNIWLKITDQVQSLRMFALFTQVCQGRGSRGG